MKNKKKIIILSAVGVAVLAVVLVLTLVCFHSWTDATCDAPMTCKKCGKTKGEALSHEWIAATCKEAKHCSRWVLTDGEPLYTALTKRLVNYRKPVRSAALQRGSLSVMPSTTGK